MPLPDAQAGRTSALRQLIDTLFDFESLPGRYPLTLREPRVLFNGSQDVLLLAAGRPVRGLVSESIDMSRLKQAACFFVRAAMLRPGADHYTVLGLESDFNKNSLRLHYRILIRLTHPDFVGNGNGEAWPAGSATRINLAYDVLSSSVLQAEYNQTLLSNKRRGVLLAQSLAAVLPRPAVQSNKLFKHKPWALVGAGIFALLLLVTLWPVNSDNAHERQVAQTKWPDFLGTVPTGPGNPVRPLVKSEAFPSSVVTVLSPVSADNGSKDLNATVPLDDGNAASQQALVAHQIQVARVSREAKEAEIANSARAEKLAQLAQQANVARLGQSVKAVRDAGMGEVAQAAALKELQLAHEAALARAKLTALASPTALEARAATLLVQTAKAVQEVQPSKPVNEDKTAKLTQTAPMLQASKTAQASLEFKTVTSVQLVRLIKETQLTLTARLPNNAETLITEVVSPTGNAASVKLLVVQPVSDAAAKPNLVDAQPALNQLIQSMQAGRGEDLLRGLERSISRSSGAADLVSAYNLLIDGSRAVRVGRVQLRGRPNGDQLAVDGVVQLILQDQGHPLPVRELQLRAAFAMRDGQVVMTELSTSGSRP